MCPLKNIKSYYAILGEGLCHVGLQEMILPVEVWVNGYNKMLQRQLSHHMLDLYLLMKNMQSKMDLTLFFVNRKPSRTRAMPPSSRPIARII